MCKKFLPRSPMSTAFVDEAADKAKWLVHREMRGPGDLENAMRRVETRYGIPFGALWALRYRKPKDIMTSVYVGIVAAHDAECDRQMKLLEHERTITKAKTGIAARLVRAADALLGQAAE